LPQVRHWFRDGGTEYRRTFDSTPLCCPARAAIMTGTYLHNNRVWNNGDDAVANFDVEHSIESYLKSAGYRTGIFGKYFNEWPRNRDPAFFDRWAVADRGYYGSTFNVQGTSRWISQYYTSYV